mgnify:FL=1
MLHFPNPGRLFDQTLLTRFWQNGKGVGHLQQQPRAGQADRANNRQDDVRDTGLSQIQTLFDAPA